MPFEHPRLDNGGGEWEDIEDPPTNRPPLSTGIQVPVSSRQRRGYRRQAFSLHSSRRLSQRARPTGHAATGGVPANRARHDSNITTEEIKHFLSLFLKGIFSVVKNWPFEIGLLVSIWVLYLILVHLASATLSTTLPAFCSIPGLSLLPFCPSLNRILRPDYPRLVEVQTVAFDKLLDETSGSSLLALGIKKSEMATVDLAMLVRVSQLKSRGQLADLLTEFAEEARSTSIGLQKLSSHVTAAVDITLSFNNYALQEIATAHASQPYKYSLRALLPGSQNQTNEIVLSSFKSAMETSSRQLSLLLIEARSSLTSLNKLEERLTAFYELIVIEDRGLAGERNELLARLWTKLGGNRKALCNVEEHLMLLRDIGGYHKKALAHVIGAIQTLTGMSADIEVLRERVTRPEAVGDEIPVVVHMQSIQIGLGRLRERKGKAQEVRTVGAGP